MSTLEPEDWLTDLETGTVNKPLTHKRIPDFADRVAARVAELNAEHHLVTSLAELRHATALTQTDVARNWGRSQSRVSTIESADITTVEIGTLVDYARALNGHVEIRVTVKDHTYIEQLA